ncbi:DegT/DnrJ/EryC1/StrS family aminotransferase [Varibaculum prostatecancerukia]|uniref:DegT/DnrJ/EryC1/StrS family aminotransferase n=1 Tax=Varibaculum prostatecancerukia TaxID=2811781 RepID=UPI001C0082CA|nr:DegT/DnrJ/EryC1/StrS family aminotransferase [Varibaculum prostatecancerukia]
MTQSAFLPLKNCLATLTDTRAEDWFLFMRARHGMATVYQTLHQCFGQGTVTTQAYTCVTAINPILVAGLKPEYGDIDPDSIALVPDFAPLHEQTRAVVWQNTFGILADSKAALLRSRVQSTPAIFLEDSAHCVGSMLRDNQGEPLADISVHSFGVEKLLPTKFGGAIWINPRLKERSPQHQRFVEELKTACAGVRAPQGREEKAMRRYFNQVRVLNHLPQMLSAPLRKTLIKTDRFLAPIIPLEQQGKLDRAPALPSKWVADQALSQLNKIEATRRRRQQVQHVYQEKLRRRLQIPADISDSQALVRFPIFVEGATSANGAESLFSFLHARGYYPGRWYRPALFPGVKDYELYNLDPELSDLPNTERLIESAINLPTQESVPRAQEIVSLVNQWVGDNS